ncbi:FlgD immunoglobulin-like domain containing protein [Kineosporia babensis]|uniref:FlgD/Vpr Ig-like domain-containing protein n=1 Tax=Kineosporia babensis TaxID=499548 RepID=A0A9X1NCQ1_9ACTN|nr:FlgD immunoglobulin-like domain containing protein [Kineosporia babensis]MCD5311344.1 hypothetical protein [Kineosporia babensis]
MTNRAGRRTLTAAAVTALVLALTTPSAQASDNSTPVPLHPTEQVSITLLGGSAEGYAAQVAKPVSGGYGIFTSANGEQLVERQLPVPADRMWDVTFLGVVGQQLGYVFDQPGNPTRYEMHRLNVVTGVDAVLGTVTSRPLAFTADSWIGTADGYLVSTRFDNGAATRLAKVPPNSYGFDLTTDGLLAQTSGTDGETHLDLVDFTSGTTERVATEKAGILGYDISPTTITWWRNQTVGEPQPIKIRARSGGPVTTYEETDDWADNAQKVAGSDGIGYVYKSKDNWRLRTVSTSGAVETVVLPDESGSLRADGSRWLFSVGGRGQDAGVYTVEGTTPTRVATVDAPDAPVWGISMAAGRVYYSDNPIFDNEDNYPLARPTPMHVWSRPVTGLGRPVLGDEVELDYGTAFLPGDPARSMSFSAGRGVVSDQFTGGWFNWRLLDRGRTSATIKQEWSFQPTGESDDRYPNLSGPYMISAGHVFDAAGRQIYSRPGAAAGELFTWSGNDDLYGPRLVYTKRAKNGDTDIWLRDLDRPKSKKNPGKLASSKVSSPKVTIWGNTVAWQSGGRELSVRNLSSSKVRKVKITGPLVELTSGEGTLAWNANAKTYTLNLNSAKSVPWAYAAAGRTIRLDDHYLARRVSTGAVVVYRSYAVPYRPRLIGTFAPAGFTPNGDGRADTWTPQFDLSKPVNEVKLTIRSTRTGSTLRTLTGTGPDGSIRDLVFDGRNGAGKALANGSYSWELTAEAKDGEGAAIGIRGEKKITGTLKISKV